MHSAASDGSQTPEEIIAACHNAGLELNAITDHDNTDAQAAAVAASARYGRPYLTGVEISVRHRGELHILGYGMDVGHRGFHRMMEELRRSRVDRIHCIIAALARHGIDVTLEDVQKQAGGNTLGRPHVALALVARGYAEGYQEAFTTYLNENGLCYVQRRKLNAREAIDLIHSAGGLAVLAHPGLVTTDDPARMIHQLRLYGLDGLEAFYPAHSDAQVAGFCRLAQDLGMLVTAGSDSHGAYRDADIGGERRTNTQLRQSLSMLMEHAVQPPSLDEVLPDI